MMRLGIIVLLLFFSVLRAQGSATQTSQGAMGTDGRRISLLIRDKNIEIKKIEDLMTGKPFDEGVWSEYMKARDELAYLLSLVQDQNSSSALDGSSNQPFNDNAPDLGGLYQMRPLSESAKAALKQATCVPLTEDKRDEVMKYSEPEDFSRTRYSLSGQNRMWDFSDKSGHDGYVTDCSHFVHEVYAVSGMRYPYMRVTDLMDSGLFRKVDLSEAEVGDFVVGKYPSDHVGILARKGQALSDSSIYSATRGGPGHLSSRPTNDKHFLPAITQFSLSQLRMQRNSILRLDCGQAKKSE